MTKQTTIQVRIDEQEKSEIKSKADSLNMTISEYIRFVSLNTTVVVETKQK
jgi:antitoxin component of RelBE/YafQ-DinJ toxin-antitoxin module